MDKSNIFALYDRVLSADILRNGLSEEDIRAAIVSMHVVYNKETASLSSARSSVADYNDSAHRCAYLHKYAAFHTALVQDVFTRAVRSNYRLFYQKVHSLHGQYNICCLGGGPGNDVIAVLSALHHFFSYFPAAATIVDYMFEWRRTFMSILHELGSGNYGAFGNNCHYFLNWRYLGANLLKKLGVEVENTIASADLVTMVKFASATACQNTESMIYNVFYQMKPGGIILFIDNSAGGYQQLVTGAATKYGFLPIFGPLKHELFELDTKIKRFGFRSCCKTTVAVHLWMKPNVDASYIHPMTDSLLSFPRISPWARLGPSPPRLCAESPLTPFVFVAKDQNATEVTLRKSENMHDDNFIRDVDLPGPNFHSPILELPQSPNNLYVPNTPVVDSPSVYAPKSRYKKSRKGNAGCFPFNWRKKIHSVKYRARNLFKKAPPLKHPEHPVFRL